MKADSIKAKALLPDLELPLQDFLEIRVLAALEELQRPMKRRLGRGLYICSAKIIVIL